MSARSTANSATQAFVLLVARLGFAAILLGRAWWRWSIEGMDAQAARIAEFNIPQPELIAWGTVLLEGVGGAMLALGLLTRVVAALVAVENVVIMAIMKWSSGNCTSMTAASMQLALACGVGLHGRGDALRRSGRSHSSASVAAPRRTRAPISTSETRQHGDLSLRTEASEEHEETHSESCGSSSACCHATESEQLARPTAPPLRIWQWTTNPASPSCSAWHRYEGWQAYVAATGSPEAVRVARRSHPGRHHPEHDAARLRRTRGDAPHSGRPARHAGHLPDRRGRRRRPDRQAHGR